MRFPYLWTDDRSSVAMHCFLSKYFHKKRTTVNLISLCLVGVGHEERCAGELTKILNESPISTHILDTTLGKPASNIKVQIYFLRDSNWILMSEGFTNDNGRHVSDIKRSDFASGTYKLKFQVDEYYKRNNQTSIYPFIEVSVNLSCDEEYYHIPLLLNPYSYSTYRGS